MRYLLNPIGYGMGTRTYLWRRILRKIFDNAERLSGNIQQMEEIEPDAEVNIYKGELKDSLRDIACALSGYDIEFKKREKEQSRNKQETIAFFKKTFYELLEESQKEFSDMKTLIKEKMPIGCKVYPDELTPYVIKMEDANRRLENFKEMENYIDAEAESFVAYQEDGEYDAH
jgi:hypothetical protein